LEQLIRTSLNGSYQPNNDNASQNSSPVVPTDFGSPSLERTEDSISCYINIEGVLSWPIFKNQGFHHRLDLKSLLQSNKDHGDLYAMSVAPDLGDYEASQLLQQFLDNVHIFNPVPEEAKVKDYVRNARFNGISWDAQSCLLVRCYIQIYRAVSAHVNSS
jgi:hypothetical protein